MWESTPTVFLKGQVKGRLTGHTAASRFHVIDSASYKAVLVLERGEYKDRLFYLNHEDMTVKEVFSCYKTKRVFFASANATGDKILVVLKVDFDGIKCYNPPAYDGLLLVEGKKEYSAYTLIHDYTYMVSKKEVRRCKFTMHWHPDYQHNQFLLHTGFETTHWVRLEQSKSGYAVKILKDRTERVLWTRSSFSSNAAMIHTLEKPAVKEGVKSKRNPKYAWRCFGSGEVANFDLPKLASSSQRHMYTRVFYPDTSVGQVKNVIGAVMYYLGNQCILYFPGSKDTITMTREMNAVVLEIKVGQHSIMQTYNTSHVMSQAATFDQGEHKLRKLFGALIREMLLLQIAKDLLIIVYLNESNSIIEVFHMDIPLEDILITSTPLCHNTTLCIGKTSGELYEMHFNPTAFVHAKHTMELVHLLSPSIDASAIESDDQNDRSAKDIGEAFINQQHDKYNAVMFQSLCDQVYPMLDSAIFQEHWYYQIPMELLLMLHRVKGLDNYTSLPSTFFTARRPEAQLQRYEKTRYSVFVNNTKALKKHYKGLFNTRTINRVNLADINKLLLRLQLTGIEIIFFERSVWEDDELILFRQFLNPNLVQYWIYHSIFPMVPIDKSNVREVWEELIDQPFVVAEDQMPEEKSPTISEYVNCLCQNSLEAGDVFRAFYMQTLVRVDDGFPRKKLRMSRHPDPLYFN